LIMVGKIKLRVIKPDELESFPVRAHKRGAESTA
jgi:hypothetical protein